MTHLAGKTVFSLEFSPDGRYLASGVLDRDGLKIWEVAGARLLRSLPGFGAVGWLPGTTTVLSTRSDEDAPDTQIGGWDAVTGRRTLSLPGGGVYGYDLGVSRDGAYLAVADGENLARVWRLADRRTVAAMPGVQSLAFASGGTLVTSDGNGWLRAWRIPSGREIRPLTTEGDLRPPSRLAATPNGLVLAAGSDPSRVGSWQVDRGVESIGFIGFGGTIADIGLSADGKTVVVTGTDAPTTVFRRAVDWLTHRSVVRDIAVDRPGHRLASTTTEGTVSLWDVDAREEVAVVRPDGAPASVAYAPDGTLAVTTARGTVELRDRTGRRTAVLPAGDGSAGGAGGAGAVAFSPDGALLAAAVAPAGEGRHRIVVWETAGLRRRGVLDTGTADPARLMFTPDGAMLIAATTDGEVVDLRIRWRSAVWTWRASDLTRLGRHDVGAYQVTDAALSPDGRRLAVVGTDRRIDLRSPDGATRLARVAPHPSTIRSVAFSPDGRTLASTAIFDTYVRLWDAATGAPRARLIGHYDALNTLAFGPDDLLASGSVDTAVGLWQLDAGEAVRRVCGLVVPADRAEGRRPPAACR
jgi:WD40 repeat protein